MHKWQFFKSARCVQAKVETGDDLLALKELDKKLWTVLAAPTTGVRFDAATLKLLDADGDGRVRVPEVLAAVDWMAARFKKLDFLFAGNAEIPLDELKDDTPEGQALLKSFKNLLARAGGRGNGSRPQRRGWHRPGEGRCLLCRCRRASRVEVVRGRRRSAWRQDRRRLCRVQGR